MPSRKTLQAVITKRYSASQALPDILNDSNEPGMEKILSNPTLHQLTNGTLSQGVGKRFKARKYGEDCILRLSVSFFCSCLLSTLLWDAVVLDTQLGGLIATARILSYADGVYLGTSPDHFCMWLTAVSSSTYSCCAGCSCLPLAAFKLRGMRSCPHAPYISHSSVET
ncbi:hypothetical protein BDQ17DRAFT_778034 [Cyathus striatus]|nr:hypothetical protein BDQ17DRAFT_778034 [Cyathus striatus]